MVAPQNDLLYSSSEILLWGRFSWLFSTIFIYFEIVKFGHRIIGTVAHFNSFWRGKNRKVEWLTLGRLADPEGRSYRSLRATTAPQRWGAQIRWIHRPPARRHDLCKSEHMWSFLTIQHNFHSMPTTYSQFLNIHFFFQKYGIFMTLSFYLFLWFFPHVWQ